MATLQNFEILADSVSQKISKKQPLQPCPLLFMSRNQFFWIPHLILHRRASLCVLPQDLLAVFPLLSKVPQICPNFSLMTSYRKLTCFSDNGTIIFELSGHFYIRKHLLDNQIKRWETPILISDDALNFKKTPKSEKLPQVTSSGPSLSSSPIFAFQKHPSNCQLQMPLKYS